MSNKTDITRYLNYISKSKFVISPPGNGIDCHRIWECMFLGTTPIVLYNECFSQFNHLPILFVDSWEEVTTESLRNKVDNYSFDNIKELTLDYWREKICI